MKQKQVQGKQEAQVDKHAAKPLKLIRSLLSWELKCLHDDKPFSLTTEHDVVQWMLFLIAVITRFWNLEQPRAVVFDEVFYGRYASMYWKNTFYFDPHPPLGKMLVAAAGRIGGADENFKFDKIGAVYTPGVPIWHLRFVPALTGSLLVPVTYQIIVELGLSRWTATVGALLVILDNALLTQSRLILMEGPLLFFTAFAIVSYLKFKSLQNKPFHLGWWVWLICLGVAATSAISVKYLGVFSVVILYTLMCVDFWGMLPSQCLTTAHLWKEALSRTLCLVVLPVALYIAIFHAHFSLLYKAGPQDDIMTSAFQASLKGGLEAITKGQPLEISYGSQITLRHSYGGQPCWLHSHVHVYPIRYPDSRGSSHQQQVTCYTYKDVNNWWIIKDPTRNTLMVDDPVRPVKHGDIIQLIHGLTSRALNSHDVAAPVSPQHQEVTCYIDYNISYPAQNLWKVEIVNAEDDQTWKTIHSHVRLVHVNTSQALKTSGRQLPDWGFHQFEVVTDKQTQHEGTSWNVEEHRYTRTSDELSTERDLAKREMIPLQPVQLGFFSKFWELQVKMLSSGKDEIEHRYSSDPTEWPLMDRNVAYWYSPRDNAQVHLVGNLVIWLSGSAGVIVFTGLLVFYVLRRRRDCWDMEQEEWEKFRLIGTLLLAGYFVNYIPYFMTDKTLFLHNYLPALYFKILLLAALVEHVHSIVVTVSYMQTVYHMVVLVWLAAIFMAYCKLTAVSYGTAKLSSQNITSLQWRYNWDFIQVAGNRL